MVGMVLGAAGLVDSHLTYLGVVFKKLCLFSCQLFSIFFSAAPAYRLSSVAHNRRALSGIDAHFSQSLFIADLGTQKFSAIDPCSYYCPLRDFVRICILANSRYYPNYRGPTNFQLCMS